MTLCAIGLSIEDVRPKSTEPITLIVDSTGLKIHRGSGWHETKHGSRKPRKSWRNLAEQYLKKGWSVVGCCRGDSDLSHERYSHFELDVADEAPPLRA